MSFYEDVQNAFKSEIKGLSGLVYYVPENIRYRPDLDENWIRTTLLPREPNQGAIGRTGRHLYGGLLQVDVFIPIGNDAALAAQEADKLISHFTKGKTINSGSTSITIEKAWVETAISDDTWYQLPVFIRWYSFKSF